ncbi:MAG: DUF4384 domain-containing protein [Acidobacteriota bacterium]
MNKVRCVLLIGCLYFAVALPVEAEKPLRARDLFLSGTEQQRPPKSGEPISAKTSYPLGLRYSILKQVGQTSVEVDPESVFRSGDRIRLNVQANDTGFLYIVLRGSSGRWSPLFPSKEILNGNNRVERGNQYEIPLGSVWFAFDEQPGTEKLFIVLSRQPEPDFEKLVKSLRDSSGESANPPQKASESKGEESAVQVVSSLDDEAIGKMRGQVRSRDLIFEKVEDGPPGGKKEKAVYVVNRTGKSDSRVVVDVSLNHQ